MNTERKTSEQINLATNARGAGNNYFENLTLVRFGHSISIRDDDERDAMALRNEDVFHSRFGIDLPQELRPDVLSIKQVAKLTDRRVRHLVRAGILRRDGDQVALRPSRTIEVISWFMVTMCLLVGIVTLILGRASATSLLEVATHAGVLLAFTLLAKATHYTFIEPSVIARRALHALRAQQLCN